MEEEVENSGGRCVCVCLWEGVGVMSHTRLVSALKMINVGANTHAHTHPAAQQGCV